MTYKFFEEINIITDEVIEQLYEGDIGILLLRNVDENVVERFGELLPQDLYSNKVVPVGSKDKGKDHVWSTTEMLWHQDRAYNTNVHPFVGLYCIAADPGSSPTYFLDMQKAYTNSSDDLKEKTEDVLCVNEVAKYFKQKEYPHNFRTPAWERAYRMKARAEHPLVQSDKHGKYYFYSPAYTITEYEEQLKEECIKDEYTFVHYWRPRDLLVYNNLKTLHKRDDTDSSVDRRHLRFAIGKK
jgi:alpha-ketoglutarate-dependent taurine dioxygenase